MVHEPLWYDDAPCSADLFAPPPCVTASLQGLDFESGSRARSRITLGGWEGWTNGPARTGGPVPWEHADGGIKADVYATGRRITLEGLIIEPSPGRLWERMEELGSILTSPRWDQLVITEEHLNLVRQIEVTRLQQPMITPRSSRIAAYTLELEAADSRRTDVDVQSATISTAGTALQNIGTVDADLNFTLTGPLTTPGFSWSGGAWSYGGNLAAGERLFVDATRRTVRDPDTTGHSREKLLGLGAGSWPRLAPGTTTFWRTGSGAGSISVSWRSSWA